MYRVGSNRARAKAVAVACDLHLVERVREKLPSQPGLQQKNMFGGQAFMLDGHMVCGVLNDTLIVRIGPEATARALENPHTRPMDFTGKVMKAYTVIEPEGLLRDDQLEGWLRQALRFVATLPAK